MAEGTRRGFGRALEPWRRPGGAATAVREHWSYRVIAVAVGLKAGRMPVK